MDLALPRQLGIDPACADPETGDAPAAGVSPGVNIAPGSDDDGWIIPEPTRLADGTTVQLYKDGEALHVAYDAIAAAKFLICLEVYIFANDETGRAFTDILCRKAREGVRVYVLYDDLGSLGAGELFKRLAAAGVRLASFHPVLPWELKFSWRPWNRHHRKLLVIDNEIAGMGGLNVGGNYAGSWVVRNVRNLSGRVAGERVGRAMGSAAARVAGGSKAKSAMPSSGAIGDTNGEAAAENPACDFWRDTSVGIRGPAARQFQQAFARSWAYVSRGGRIKRAEFIHGLDGNSNADNEL